MEVALTEQEKRWLVARSLSARAARLLRLIELAAPEIIIENERRLVAQALEKFPVNEEMRRQVDAEREREKHIRHDGPEWKAGFAAREAGAAGTANPHEQQTPAWINWDDGWQTADAEAEIKAIK